MVARLGHVVYFVSILIAVWIVSEMFWNPFTERYYFSEIGAVMAGSVLALGYALRYILTGIKRVW